MPPVYNVDQRLGRAAAVNHRLREEKQTRLSAELVERLVKVLVHVADAAMRDFSRMKRALAVPLVQVASPETMKPIFPPAEFQIGALALEKTSVRGASERTGMVEKAVREEVRLGLATSAAAAIPALAARVEVITSSWTTTYTEIFYSQGQHRTDFVGGKHGAWALDTGS
ncbi:hypothetical protein HPB48_026972 [Haemaphysalis longicornis]|uniref:Uncharacterized protein n=1 Tax=Haemaphysalis longicornis TaxID=44386 RepID=A0A9J6HDN1_HAELO|nr:hypothetical protein HPB48_026972 [Haemaphysalis longicornis]